MNEICFKVNKISKICFNNLISFNKSQICFNHCFLHQNLRLIFAANDIRNLQRPQNGRLANRFCHCKGQALQDHGPGMDQQRLVSVVRFCKKSSRYDPAALESVDRIRPPFFELLTKCCPDP